MDFLDIVGQLSRGVGYTLMVTLVSSLTGVAVGLTVAGLRRLRVPGVATLLDLFTYFFRSVPVLVLLFMMYFGLPSVAIKVPPLAAMALSLGLVAGAYLAEVFRGALEAVDGAEILAARAMGLGRLQVFAYIELPQMLRFAVPGMVNEFTSILKYSPFAYTVGIPEITKQAMTLTSTTLQGVEIYLAVGVLYFAIYRILLVGVRLIEKRYRVPGMVLS